MNKEKSFLIQYKLTGTRQVIVNLPEDEQLPELWDIMTGAEKDEWLYERQISSRVHMEDVDFAEAKYVIPYV